MSKRKEIILDDETSDNIDYLSKVMNMNPSKVIKRLINVFARVLKEKSDGR